MNLSPSIVILAGGLSRRMDGQPKALMTLAGQPLIAHVIDRVAPQSGNIAINAKGDTPGYGAFDLPILPDVIAGQPGPLAGILTAMTWAAARGEDRVLTVSADAPFLPGDFVPRLLLAAETASDRPVIAASGGRLHPVCGLWPVALKDDLARALDEGTRRVRQWSDHAGAVTADFPATDPDPFFNINTPDDLRRAEAYLKGPP